MKLTAFGLESIRGSLVQRTESLLDSVGAMSRLSPLSLGHGRSRQDVVDDIRNLRRQAILIGSEQLNARSAVLVDVVASLEDLLELANIGLDSEPSLGLVYADAALGNARLNQPSLDSGNGLFTGSKQVNNLFVAQVLAVVARVGVGAVIGASVSYVSISHRCEFGVVGSCLHVVEALLGLCNVVLLEGNADSEVLVAVGGSPLGDVRELNGALLMHDVLFGRGHGEASGGQAGDEEGCVGLHGYYSWTRTKTNGIE